MYFSIENEIKMRKMSCIPKCQCFKAYFSETNVRNPILAKPLVWSPKIAIFSIIVNFKNWDHLNYSAFETSEKVKELNAQ